MSFPDQTCCNTTRSNFQSFIGARNKHVLVLTKVTPDYLDSRSWNNIWWNEIANVQWCGTLKAALWVERFSVLPVIPLIVGPRMQRRARKCVKNHARPDAVELIIWTLNMWGTWLNQWACRSPEILLISIHPFGSRGGSTNFTWLSKKGSSKILHTLLAQHWMLAELRKCSAEIQRIFHMLNMLQVIWCSIRYQK